MAASLCMVLSGLGWFYVAHLRHVEDVGLHPNSSNAWYARLFSEIARDAADLSFKSPNEIACVGQASAHAVTTLPSARCSRFFRFEFARLNALHAHAALLHNPTASAP